MEAAPDGAPGAGAMDTDALPEGRASRWRQRRLQGVGTADDEVQTTPLEHRLPADVFRERILALANEYARLELAVTGMTPLEPHGRTGHMHDHADSGSTLARSKLPSPPERLKWCTPAADGNPGALRLNFWSGPAAADAKRPPRSATPKTREADAYSSPRSASSRNEARKDPDSPLSLRSSWSLSPTEAIGARRRGFSPTSSSRLPPSESVSSDDDPDASRSGHMSEFAAPSTSAATDRSKTFAKKKLRRLRTTSFTSSDNVFLYIAQSTNFDKIIGMVILVNVAFMGITTDRDVTELRNGNAKHPAEATATQALEILFFVLYVIELAIRLAAFQMSFFLDPHDRCWNWFDLVLVLQSATEQISNFLNVATITHGGSLSFLRAMRIIKMIKMLRVVRLMRSMREVRLVLNAIMGCMRSMLWSVVLLVVVLLMFGLIFVQGVVDFMAQQERLGVDVESSNEIWRYWGSVSTAMITLFKSSSGGIDWEDAMDALLEAEPAFALLFLLYIAFFIFVVLNTITALFVENTIAHSSKDFQSSIQNELEKKQEYLKSLQMLFDEMDEHGQGEVTLQEFERQIENPKLVAFFASLEIEITDASHFFNMLSDHGNKSVTLDTFVTGCIRMRGQALAVDLHYLTTKHANMHGDLTAFMQRAELRFEDLQRKFASLQVELGQPANLPCRSPRREPVLRAS